MFYNCKELQDISALANWDVSKVENMYGMFEKCEQLQDITALANWDVSKVENMYGMFEECQRLEDITALANWDVSKVKNMGSMFDGCKRLYDITALANWDVSNVWYMDGMFRDCVAFPQKLQCDTVSVKAGLSIFRLNQHHKNTDQKIFELQKENDDLKARLSYLEEKLTGVMSQLSEMVKWNP
jgi:surface protein